VRGLKLKWENSNETNLNLASIPSHKGCVTWFLTLAPPKSTPTPSFNVTWKVWLIFVHWHPLFLYLHLPLCSTKKILKRNYKKRHPLMLISQSLGLAPSNPLKHEGCWAHGLGLGFLGLGLILRRLIRRTSNSLGLVHFFYWWSLYLCVEMTLQI